MQSRHYIWTLWWWDIINVYFANKKKGDDISLLDFNSSRLYIIFFYLDNIVQFGKFAINLFIINDVIYGHLVCVYTMIYFNDFLWKINTH